MRYRFRRNESKPGLQANHRVFRRHRLAAIISSLPALALLLAPSPVGAAAAVHFTDSITTISCQQPLVGPTGVAVLSDASVSSKFGPSADVSFWAGVSAPAGDPTVATDYSSQPTGSATSTSISMTIPLATPRGDPAGTARLDAALAPDGDPVPFGDRSSDTNHLSRTSGTSQALTIVSGSLTIGGETLSLVACSGDLTVISLFQSNPNSFVARPSGIQVNCSFQTADGFIALDGFANSLGAYADVTVDPQAWFGEAGSPDVTLTDQAFAASIPLVDEATGDPTGSSATVQATLASAGPIQTQILRFQTGFEKDLLQPLSVSGTLTIPQVATFDLSSCQASDFQSLIVSTNAQGPKPGTQLAVNDTPSGAVTITLGTTLNAQTANTQLDAEASFSCIPSGLPAPGHTLWYTFTGTGGPVSVDTAGSNFDTVLAAYTASGSTFTELACDDDVPTNTLTRTLQAAVTLDTQAGVTYFVQAGGFGGEYGRLRLSIR